MFMTKRSHGFGTTRTNVLKVNVIAAS